MTCIEGELPAYGSLQSVSTWCGQLPHKIAWCDSGLAVWQRTFSLCCNGPHGSWDDPAIMGPTTGCNAELCCSTKMR